MTFPIQISTTFHENQFVFASLNDANNELDFEYLHIYLYEKVGKTITFRVEYEDDLPHTIYLFDTSFNSSNGVNISYYMGNIFKFSKIVTFKIQFSFNKNVIEPNKLRSLKIFVKNEKNISKSLSIKIYIEDPFSIPKFLLKGIKRIFYEREVDEIYWKLPHIGCNHRLAKYKLLNLKKK